MNINVRTSWELFFEQFLQSVNSYLGKNKLKPLELKILSKLLYIDHIYSKHSKEDRNKILFHRETKKRIRESFHPPVSKESLNNVLMSLRKKKMLTKSELLVNVPIEDNNLEIVINFNINE